MISINVTSDSSTPELRVAARFIDDLINLNVGKEMEADCIKPTFKVPEPTFNAAELAEAETLGKPVASTVDVSQSTTAPVDTTVNISTPTPQSVFGQPAQTTENVVNHAVPLSELHAHDVDGIKWDKRIHSSSKELNKDGTWRKRRGVDDALVRTVEAELRGTPVSHGSPIPQVIAEIDYVPAPAPAVSNVHVVYPPPEAFPQPTVAEATMTFPELLDGVTKAMVSGQLNQATIAAALDSVGLTALPHLLGNTALIPAFRTALGGVV